MKGEHALPSFASKKNPQHWVANEVEFKIETLRFYIYIYAQAMKYSSINRVYVTAAELGYVWSAGSWLNLSSITTCSKH